MTIAELCRDHRSIGIDSVAIIHLLEGAPPLADRAGELLDAIAGGLAVGVLASIAIAEVTTGPARVGDLGLVDRYRDELTSLENVLVQPLDAAIAADAAVLRGLHGMALPDAVHLASVRAGGATAFVTNDRRIRPIHGVVPILLDDLGP